MSLRETINNVHSRWMNGDAPEADVVISSRIRLARNLARIPYPHLLKKEEAEEVLSAVQLAVEHKKLQQAFGGLDFTRLNELLPIERQILVEKHLISPDLLEDIEKRAIVLSGDEVVSIMVNEEDHLRIQCLLPGLQLKEAWSRADKLDDGLEQTLDYAYGEQLGYLTACPTNVGTGMRASVMVHLPGLVLIKQINGVLSTVAKLGLVVRGLYGEGTETKGNFFQISNQITLGQTEEEIIANIASVTKQLIEQERMARKALLQESTDQLKDMIGRAYGTLQHAYVITSEETLKLLSLVRLGVDMGIIEGLSPTSLTELMVMTRPAYLMKLSGKEMSPYERDVYRARLIRERLAERR